MPIDTSSYYPETPTPDGEEGYSLNSRSTGLFGRPEPQGTPELEPDRKPEPKPEGGDGPAAGAEPRSVAEKAADAFANVLSWLTVPLMMPVYGILFIFGLTILALAPAPMKLSFVGITAGISLVMPMLLFWLLKRLGVIQDVALNGRKERLVPYIITITAFLLTAWFMVIKGAPLWMAMFFCGGAVAAAVNLTVNLWWKISAHAAGVAGLVALLLRISQQGMVSPSIFLWLLITVGGAGLLGSARVWLGRHTVWQVLAGYAVGFCSVFFMMAIE